MPAAGRPRQPGQVGFLPEHVPPFIPQDWADRHLDGFTGISSLILRRTAATHLVRRARGGSLNEAAQFLGIQVSEHGIGFGTTLGRWARTQDNIHAFDIALDAIVAELEASPLIDYHYRRRCLADWTLPATTWTHMLSQLQQPLHRVITDDRKRLAVSAYIWARVTQGEYFFSPCPSEIAADSEACRRPALVDRAEQALSQVDGVQHVGHVRMRWIGHALRAETAIVVDPTLTAPKPTPSPSRPNTLSFTPSPGSLPPPSTPTPTPPREASTPTPPSATTPVERRHVTAQCPTSDATQRAAGPASTAETFAEPARSPRGQLGPLPGGASTPILGRVGS